MKSINNKENIENSSKKTAVNGPQDEAATHSSQRLSLAIDPILLLISVISFVTRFHQLEHPRSVVFDELHYIKFVTLYVKKIFFFDPQPPFGKQLMSLVSWLANFQGDLSYTKIGDEYKPEVPLLTLRLLPCICGTLIAPLTYLISLEFNLRQSVAALVSIFIILENSLLTQSRFFLIEPILIVLSVLTLYCYLRFAKSTSKQQQYSSFIWLSLASICASLAVCTKYSGFYTLTTLILLVTYTWWHSIDREQASKPIKLITKTIVYSTCIFLLPVGIYISVYYAHLSWLTKAGPHDNIMTSAFQASLEGGLASITKGQPLEIVHGSQITLRHTHGRSCWLHSHEHLYPVKYSDGRGSSHQQQVTCYSFKDVNNWWIVKRPHIDELVVTEPYDKIRDGDLIQLVHGLSGRALNSHDVASAMSPYSQEVSCYVDHNISMPAQNVWKVKLGNPQDTGGNWHTLNSRIQLIHLNSSLALKFSGLQLPDWGFHQHEIVADKNIKSLDTVWNVEEHRHTKSEDQKEREAQFGQAEFLPLQPTTLTFLEKFFELHYKLFVNQRDPMKDHIYACETPLDWIFQSKGTAYWVDSSLATNSQIFLIGNVTINMIGLISIFLFCSSLVLYILRRRRGCLEDFKSPTDWNRFQYRATVLLTGYLMNIMPYFLYESPLFLQYYLNALIFKILIIGAFVDHFYDRFSLAKGLFNDMILIILIAISLNTFVKLSPLSYGFKLNKQELDELRWKDTWQLINLKN